MFQLMATSMDLFWPHEVVIVREDGECYFVRTAPFGKEVEIRKSEADFGELSPEIKAGMEHVGLRFQFSSVEELERFGMPIGFEKRLLAEIGKLVAENNKLRELAIS